MNPKNNSINYVDLNNKILEGRLWRLTFYMLCTFITILVTSCGQISSHNKAGKLDKQLSGSRKEIEYTVPSLRQNPEDVMEKTKALGTNTEKDKKILKLINTMTIEEKVAQLFIITPEQLTGYSCVTQAGNATKQALSNSPVGGLILFSGNLEEETQLKQMNKKLQEYALELIGIPLFISIDEEGGSIARLGNHSGFHVPKVADMCEIGKSKDSSQAYDAGNIIGSYLNEFGFNMNFAPVADVLTNPKNSVVKSRSFGSDPDVVTDMVTAYLDGLSKNNVYGVPKHFPGHGATEGDSHSGFVYTYKTWTELEKSDLKPFNTMIKQKVPFIMVGHISMPEIIGDNTPASLSPKVIKDYLREKMGYEGIIITDALNMGAIENHYSSGQACVMALKAGVDLLLMPKDFQTAYEAVLKAINNEDISKNVVDEAVTRILKVKFD